MSVCVQNMAIWKFICVLMYMLQVKFDYRLTYFNLGWFSISFVS